MKTLASIGLVCALLSGCTVTRYVKNVGRKGATTIAIERCDLKTLWGMYWDDRCYKETVDMSLVPHDNRSEVRKPRIVSEE